jgi:hypothetical protein
MSEGRMDRDSQREAGRGLGTRIRGDAGLLLREWHFHGCIS